MKLLNIITLKGYKNMKEELLIKLIDKLLLNDNEIGKATNNSLYDECLNKYCVVRSYGAGVFFGIVKQIEDNCAVKLKDARRIHYWDAHTAASITDIALHGIKDIGSSRIAATIPLHYIQQIIEVIPCSDKAIECLINFKVWTEHA